MKLNQDLVREVLLTIEKSNQISGPDEFYLLDNVNAERNDIGYTVSILQDAGYITGNVLYGNNTYTRISPGNLTFDGHNFLDNIRDDMVWKKTKGIVSKFSSISLSIISTVAAGVITEIIKQNIK